ncbi:MAG: hypothetical protein HDS65_00755 [Bacteroidales bacterium]|nr:hypothetical protein [Bacteroidales bacterium]
MKKVLLPFAALVLGAMPAMAGANVYASGLKAENGKISFILNDKADKVVLNLLNGETVVATADLGACEKGLNTVDMPSVEAEPGTYTWSLTVSAAAVTEVTALTDGSDTNIQVSSSRGIAVDNHRQSPGFGNIYTVTPATPGQEGARVETGLYAFNAALEPINESAYTGGIEWPEKSASSPNNVAVSDNGDVFICSWGDDAANGVYWVAPDKLAENWNDVFAAGEKDGNGLMTIGETKVHGSVQDIALYGEGANRVLYTSDEDMNSNSGDIMVYAIGDLSTPWATAPTHDWGHPDGYVNANHRLASDGRGGLWLCQYRWQESDANACVYHLNAEGELDFKTGDKSVFLGSTPCAAMAVNADGTLMCVGGGDSGLTFTVASISWEDGLPVLTKLFDHSFEAPYTGKRPFDIAFDAADNVYFAFNNANAAGGIGAWALPKEKNEYTTTALGTISVETDGVESQLCETAITYTGGVIRATEAAEVYTTAGVCVARGTEIDATALAGGVYIVRAGKNSLRIIR